MHAPLRRRAGAEIGEGPPALAPALALSRVHRVLDGLDEVSKKHVLLRLLARAVRVVERLREQPRFERLDDAVRVGRGAVSVAVQLGLEGLASPRRASRKRGLALTRVEESIRRRSKHTARASAA